MGSRCGWCRGTASCWSPTGQPPDPAAGSRWPAPTRNLSEPAPGNQAAAGAACELTLRLERALERSEARPSAAEILSPIDSRSLIGLSNANVLGSSATSQQAVPQNHQPRKPRWGAGVSSYRCRSSTGRSQPCTPRSGCGRAWCCRGSTGSSRPLAAAGRRRVAAGGRMCEAGRSPRVASGGRPFGWRCASIGHLPLR